MFKKVSKSTMKANVGSGLLFFLIIFCQVSLSLANASDLTNNHYHREVSAPSLFFIIDHSGSMFQQNYQLDRWGLRFKVASALIDTFYNLFDSTEVGVAVFRKYLYYDPVDDAHFVQCPGQDTGAYLPLLTLDSSYTPSGEFGREILQKYLDTDTVTEGNYQYVDLKYKPSNLSLNGTSTNITAAFAAAKHAIKSAKYNKDRQFILFFSDGEATYPANNPNQFLEDVKEGVPTTFTIFFTEDNTVPWSIDSLTKNIKDNGYSAVNGSTNHFTINLGQQDLMKFILENIFGIITDIHTEEINLADQHIHLVKSKGNVNVVINGLSDKNISAIVYNLKGSSIATLVPTGVGNNIFKWNFQNNNGTPVNSGIYLIILKTQEKLYIQKVIVRR